MAKEPTQLNRNSKNGTAASTMLKWRTNAGPAIELYWSDVDANLLAGAVDTVSRAGAAIILGRTRDGGALSLVILYDNEKIKEYPSSVASAESLLHVLREHFD